MAMDYEGYVDSYAGLIAAAEKSGMSKEEFGKQHWKDHGKDEGRNYTPQDPKNGGDDGDKGDKGKGGGETLPGTNIKIKDLKVKNDPKTGESFADMLANTDDPNDVLFHIAYSQIKGGQGQGNPDVGKVQSGQWKLTGDALARAGGKQWAQEAVESASGTSDIYRPRGEGGGLLDVDAITGVDFGKPMTADDLARATAGVTYFTGTNIPTTGFTSTQIADYERRIAEDVAQGNWEGANDVLYGIALERGKMATPEGWTYTKPGGDIITNQFEQGNPYIGMLQSDMYTLTDPRATSWAQTVGGGQEDEYPERDAAGNLTGNVTKFNADGSSYTVDASGRQVRNFGDTTLGGYAPVGAQDWSGIMPQGVFAGSAVQPTQAMQGLVADQGLQYQPWAMPEDTVAGTPFVPQNVQYNAPLNYNPVVANQDNLNNQNNNQNNQQQLDMWQQPGWDYSGRYGGTAGQPYYMPQGWGSSLDWNQGLLTLDQQRTGWQNLAAGKAADPLGLLNQEAVVDTTTNFGFDPNAVSTHHF